ncbi:protein Hook homolog 3-like isoform X2 [Dermacentor silvarum]|uniref:protein Hook homolog 3-like isoform X2 n=1 Tax=Dermacentor silvarum TaxID=543639 RepID=UPI0021013AC2|nr:protein Hook homolog 3-like isoform X2 [Dermacentor silvarum]
MNSTTDSLICWLQTFNVSAPHKTVDQLSDGVALAQVLHKIDPDFFDSSWLTKVKTDVGSNWRLKFSNLKKILKAIIDYYNEVLFQQITEFRFPDVGAIAERGSRDEMGRLLQLILGCAVNCSRKQEYIQVIMGLEEAVQHVVMKAIQELITKESPSSYTGDNFELNEQLKKALDELHTTAQAKEQITQRCHELDMQVTMLQDEKVSLMQENEKLMEKLNHVENLEDPSTPAGRRYQQSQQRIDALQAEVFKLETAKDELRIKVEFQEKEILNLQEKNEELHKTLNEAQTLKDELDVLRHTSDKVEHYEAAIETYKKKLEDMSDLKRQLKLLEEKNTSYMQTNIELEEDVKKMAAFKSQADLYKKQTQELRLQLADETRKANRAEFEAKKLHEKLASLQTEKERLVAERDSLKEGLEDLRCSQLQKESSHVQSGAKAVGAISDSDMLETVPPEIKCLLFSCVKIGTEKLIRLQHENKMLKLERSSSEGQQVTLLKTMLEDAQSRQNDLETEVRLLSQRNLELESQLEDSREAASAHEGAEARQQLALAQRRCKELEGQLREREASLEAMATRLAESCESQSELTEQLEKKAEETRVMEERYQKYLEKAKNVIRTLDTRSPSSAEVVALRNQLQDKAKHISQLQQELEMFKAQWEKEERLISTAFYNFGAKSQQRSAEERIVQLTGGQSFLARQRQATSKRHNLPGVQTSEFFE